MMTYCKRASLMRGEIRRLTAQEDDWNLTAGIPWTTRTRGGGLGRPVLLGDIIEDLSSNEEEANEDPEFVPDSVEVEEPAKKKFAKPANNRIILEVDQVSQHSDRQTCLP
jgi:hypothetical protein